VNFAISTLALSAACLARKYLKIDNKQAVKWPVNEVEPMAPGLSVNRELRLVHPEVLMRSDLVFGAATNVPNRFLLSQLAAKAARKLHRSGARVQDTANDVLLRFSRANPIGSEQPVRVRLVVPLRPMMVRPVIPHESRVMALPSAREKSNPLWEAARVLGA
jgi:hypothetical protein